MIKIMHVILFTSKMPDATYHCISHHACGCRGRESHDGRCLGGAESRVRNVGRTECTTQKDDRVPFSPTPPASEIPLKGARQDHKKSFTSHLYTHAQAHKHTYHSVYNNNIVQMESLQYYLYHPW